MKKLVALVLVLVLAASCMVFAQADDKKSLTVMVYMCGTDLEYPPGGQGTGSIGSMIRSQYNVDEVNVVILAGGTAKWINPAYDPEVLNVVEPIGFYSTVVDTFPKASMGDPATLTHFMDYCHEKYPAEKYILTMWDHGGGPLLGIISDMNFAHDGLTMAELDTALGNSSFGPKGLEMILFHACLMGSAEVAKVVAPYANYMIGFEDASFGFEYGWLRGAENATTLEIAKNIIDPAYEMNAHEIDIQERYSDINLSLAMIDLNYMDELVAQVEEFFPDMDATLNTQTYSVMSERRRGSQTFGVTESGGHSQYDLIDLGDFVRKNRDVNPAVADQLMTTLEKMVVYQRKANDECMGLTIYHPLTNTKDLKEDVADYMALGFSKAYTSYVQKFSSLLTGSPLAEWKNLETKKNVADKAFRSMFNLSLNEEQAKHYGASQLQVLLKQEDGSYGFTFASNDVTVENGLLTAEYSGTALYAAAQDGSRLSPEITYDVIGDGLLLIPAELTRVDEEFDAEMTVKALIYGHVDAETGKVTPGSVLTWYEPYEAYTAALATTFADYDRISIPVNYRKETRNDAGTLLPFEQWEIVSTSNWTSDIDDSWGFNMVSDTIDTTKLYATFRVTDSQSHLVSSELLVVKALAADVGEMRIFYDDLEMAKVNSLTITPSAEQLQISLAVENLTDVESIIEMNSLMINGLAIEGKAEAYGSGENWGLLKGEEQYLTMAAPVSALAGVDTVTDMTFGLTVIDAATNEALGTIEVTVVLNLALAAE